MPLNIYTGANKYSELIVFVKVSPDIRWYAKASHSGYVLNLEAIKDEKIRCWTNLKESIFECAIRLFSCCLPLIFTIQSLLCPQRVSKKSKNQFETIILSQIKNAIPADAHTLFLRVQVDNTDELQDITLRCVAVDQLEAFNIFANSFLDAYRAIKKLERPTKIDMSTPFHSEGEEPQILSMQESLNSMRTGEGSSSVFEESLYCSQPLYPSDTAQLLNYNRTYTPYYLMDESKPMNTNLNPSNPHTQHPYSNHKLPAHPIFNHSNVSARNIHPEGVLSQFKPISNISSHSSSDEGHRILNSKSEEYPDDQRSTTESVEVKSNQSYSSQKIKFSHLRQKMYNHTASSASHLFLHTPNYFRSKSNEYLLDNL